jgi:threonine synthase
MNYKSTRSLNEEYVSAANAIKNGLAPDGGLYMPESIPSLSQDEIISLCEKSYAERAAYIMSKFLTEYSHDELLSDCNQAYSEKKFPGGAAPIHKIDDKVYSLELWHGPTCAFKDMALQIMPRLLSRALEKTDEKRTALILVATSGDTGKAALEGYRDVDRIKIKVFYPVNGVSRVQKLQMATQEGNNVDVCAIHGNFDDAQNGVKAIFADTEFAKELNEKDTFLSSANSINWGRLVPQVVYYVSAYCDMLKNGEIKLGDKLDVCVPTGNFGNIFAAYIAKLMGLPLGKLVCASNKNNILTDFLENGTYDRNRSFFTTISPSMDILISSNLERLIYLVCGSEKTAKYMKELKENGKYTLAEEDFAKIKENFSGYYCDEENTKKTISYTFSERKYLIDTHTAVGYYSALQYIENEKSENKIILASTASPFKFASDVYKAISGKAPTDDLSALDLLAKVSGEKIPLPLDKIGERVVRFTNTCDPKDMKDTVLAFANA